MLVRISPFAEPLFTRKVKGYTASLANTVSKALPASELVRWLH